MASGALFGDIGFGAYSLPVAGGDVGRVVDLIVVRGHRKP